MKKKRFLQALHIVTFFYVWLSMAESSWRFGLYVHREIDRLARGYSLEGHPEEPSWVALILCVYIAIWLMVVFQRFFKSVGLDE